MVRCYNCQKELSTTAQICPSCGDPDPFLADHYEAFKKEHPLSRRENLMKSVLPALGCLFFAGITGPSLIFEPMEWYVFIIALVFFLINVLAFIFWVYVFTVGYKKHREEVLKEYEEKESWMKRRIGEDWYRAYCNRRVSKK